MSAAEEYARQIRHELASDRGLATRPAPEDAVIRMEDVWLRFDHPVLSGVNLWLERGETLLVAGQAGTGKSTLLKLILRLLIPDRGRIEVCGHEIGKLSFAEALDVRRRIGMVFQNAALFDSLTVYENVAYPLRENTDMGEDEIERIVRQRLEFVDMEPDRVMAQLPGELSGGMRKRVGIARAIATEPEVVLYDEPTAGLGPIAVQTLLKLIRKLQRDLHVSSILVTHDIRAGFQVASRVNMLRDGRIAFDGSPEEMVASDDEFLQAFLS
jgi:phospholipid/cholesterol/gamma-HCH transport system ATP-binding protein